VLRQISYSTILATGLGIVIISGGIDLSVGGTAALTGIITASALQAGVNTYVALLLGITTGIACGCTNGVMISIVGIPPFIMTLAMGFISQGVIFTWTKGYPIYDAVHKR
jgi:ribose transport system permease protein